MPKRKVISESDKQATKKKLKADKNANEATSVSQLSFESPRQCLQSFVYPTSLEEFMETFWEKKHLYIARKKAKYYGDMCTKGELLEVVKKQELMYDSDLYVSRYSKDEDEEAIEASGKATTANLKKYFEKEKATVMLSRPHRFNKDLETVLQLLELHFGCCAYAHLEVTPASSQGHAPCYVGREVFNLQLEGKKRWRLYKPIIELPTHDSEDLNEEDIGEVLHEYTLEPGDMLYVPRGTVFQACSLDAQHATDISIELYDENSWGKFISSIVDKAVEEASLKEVSFREGLPLHYLSYMGFGKSERTTEIQQASSNQGKENTALLPKVDQGDIKKQQSFEEKLKKLFSTLGQYLDAHWGADYLGTWFMGNRLPPTLPEKPAGEKSPVDDSLVQMTYPEHVRIVYCKAGEGVFKGVDDDDDEDDENEDEDELDEMEDEENHEDGEQDKENDIEADKEEEDDEKVKKDKNKISKAATTKKDKDKESKGKEKGQKAKPEVEKTSKKAKSTKKDSAVAKNNNDKSAEEDEDEDMEDEDFDEDVDSSNELELTPHIILQHSVQNESNDVEDVATVPGILEFPLHYSDALLILHRSKKPVAVKELPLITEERLELTSILWAEGLLEVKELE